MNLDKGQFNDSDTVTPLFMVTTEVAQVHSLWVVVAISEKSLPEFLDVDNYVALCDVDVCVLQGINIFVTFNRQNAF